MVNPFNIHAPASPYRAQSADCNVLYYTGSIVDVGESHRARRFNCQDHARAVSCPEGVVLCVADGISRMRDETGFPQLSATEVGAWLAAELSTRAALDALARGAGPEAIRTAVAAALVNGLAPFAEQLGPRANFGLAATLVLLIITPEWTQAWASGDGYWGVLVPGWDVEVPSGVELTLMPRGTRHDPFTLISGAQHQPVLGHLATTSVKRGVEAVTAHLQPVLVHRGTALGGYVATDGLRDEHALQAALAKAPCTDRRELQALLQREPDCDDLGLAWAAERFPGMLERPMNGGGS